MTQLDGKVAVVTGAGRGLGRAEALELARLGARVVVNDVGRALDGSEEAAAHHGDVADVTAAEHLVATAVEAFGSLDVLVNNAGILRDRMIFSMTEEDFDSVVRVHLKGHFATLRAATAYWRDRSKQAGGPVPASVVNTASEAFLIGSPGQPNYAAAKAGIVALTLAVAQSCGRYGVRANAICPRARTRMTEGVFGPASNGEGDHLAAEHVAPLVAYLASDAASMISGQVFVAYGGFVGLVAAPQLEARFDASEGHWSVEDLDQALGQHFADRDPSRTYAATSILRPDATPVAT